MIRYRALRWIIAAPFAVLVLYLVVGLASGTIPVNSGWRPAETGVRVYVEDNGIHTGIVLPADGWSDIVRPEHFRDPRYARHRWRSFGWGDRAFYVETPTWWDLRPTTVLRAATGSERTVMHVDAVPEPRVGAEVRAITLRTDEYARLVAFVRTSFAPGAPVHGYGDYDAFYPARGRYSALRTCNEWAGAALRRAGVRMGAWTPFSAVVLAWLPA